MRAPRRIRRAYALALVPFLTDWIDTGHLPVHPTEYITETVVGGILALCVHRLYRDADQLRAMAERDPLTGLFNRRRFCQDLEAEVARARRLGTPLTLAYLDVDRFKAINDAFGHPTGDAVLRELASLIMRSVREGTDRCYRIGGDEFAVLVPGAGAAAAHGALRRWRGLAKPGSAVARHDVTMSIGLSSLHGAESLDAFVHRADRRMYEAKPHARASAAPRVLA